MQCFFHASTLLEREPIHETITHRRCCRCSGQPLLQEHLPAIKRTHKIDMTVVNGENSAQGNGITKHSMEQIFSAGADVITTGNHCFKRREAMAIYENPVVLRPANYPEGCPGHGVCTIDFGPCQVAVLNLSGTAYLDPLDNPFTIAEQLLEEIDTPNILVDFHAEATAEKKAMGYFLAGRVTAVVGTHTMCRLPTKPFCPNIPAISPTWA